MKKMFSLLMVLLVITEINSNDVVLKSNTALDNTEVSDIRMICTNDYCDYVRGSTTRESVNIFFNNYLDRVEDTELKNTLRVKGIPIRFIYRK